MRFLKKIINTYHDARVKGLKPSLLHSCGVFTDFSSKTIIGLSPQVSLEVWEGKLYKNGKYDGEACKIFDYLKLGSSAEVFPMWIGFFSYEFARHLSLPTRRPYQDLPEAAFYLYKEGYIWENKRLITKPEGKRNDVAVDNYEITAIKKRQIKDEVSKEKFISIVKAIQDKIKLGWVYQVNFSKRFNLDAKDIDPLSLFFHMSKNNPSPFMGLIEGKNWSVVSGSPERLFYYDGSKIKTRPIAGTRKRDENDNIDAALEHDMLTSTKERAEHAMLVDLLRNDIAKVSESGSVFLSESFTVERYSKVMHLVSEVIGSSKKSFKEMFLALFPGGTITGAPKISVMESIKELEQSPRGAYTGSLGYIDANGKCDFNILIRSCTIVEDKGYINSGAGIVINSDPQKEYQEVKNKVSSFFNILNARPTKIKAQQPKLWKPWYLPLCEKKKNVKISFIENNDSFSYNIIHYLEMLGCKVKVINEQEPNESNIDSRIVIGPGPGEPKSAKTLFKWIKFATINKIPTLGICLGHQAIGEYFGAVLAKAPIPVHGESHSIYSRGENLFFNVANTCKFARYHSLILTKLPKELKMEAWTKNKLIMSISHRKLPIFGVQFHPESFLSQNGIKILENFINLS